MYVDNLLLESIIFDYCREQFIGKLYIFLKLQWVIMIMGRTELNEQKQKDFSELK